MFTTTYSRPGVPRPLVEVIAADGETAVRRLSAGATLLRSHAIIRAANETARKTRTIISEAPLWIGVDVLAPPHLRIISGHPRIFQVTGARQDRTKISADR